MSRLKPEKLSVEFREGVTLTDPIIPRRYTLTHSDITAELFLTIGPDFANDKLTMMRDEVLGEWINYKGKYQYNVYLQVDGQFGQGMAGLRYRIFSQELSLALEAIRYGDRLFFDAHETLDASPIVVFFMSSDPQYHKVELWGSFSDYQ